MSTSDWPASALQAADTAFAALTREPAPLALDCGIFDAGLGLPAGVVALPVLRDWLLARPRAYAARDAVWRELIRRARLEGPQWVIAAVGMAMPALVRLAGHLAVGYRGDPTDIDAEVLTGFLAALRDRVDLARPAPHAGLCFAAWRAGRALRLQQQEYLPVPDVEHVTGPRTPKIPYGHPDLLIHRAVALNIMDAEDAQPYIDVRLGRRAIEPIAAAAGVSVDALRMRLARADERVAHALAAGMLTGITSAAAATVWNRQARRRAGIRAGLADTAGRPGRHKAAPLPAAAA